MRSLPREGNETDHLEISTPPLSSSLRLETAALEIRKDCHKAPKVIVVTLKNAMVTREMVGYFQKLGKVVNAIPNYPVVDIPGYFKMGFCMGTPEIYVWVRQNPTPGFEDFLVSHLNFSLKNPD